MVYIKKIDQHALIEKTFELLEREGVEAVSMRRLAALMMVRPSSLYHHFPDKAALLREIAERGLLMLAAELKRAAELAMPDPRRRIHAMGMTYREWSLRHPELYRLLFADAPPLSEGMSPASDAAFAPMLTAMGELVGEAKAPAATLGTWAFVHGYVMLELTGHVRQCLPIEGFQLGLGCFVDGLGRS
ncbi:TetR/AcrR family transcriptional regulator [Cohnella sp. REN36]|uniref:TetR/AcrR family transcriptional regulator n=1 Tax=Cohnella sp. REN36 TaxID=2887347 RepID=UPI001D143BEB|nr:TetR/AcrR family transcriptional regulator [Cohnella sp. REN36]MCC3375402.1 TetR/AcrR family transcriptional regulator [Cohnella sp. REN36]